MFSLMLHKLLHKKWIVLCLLTGNILLIAVAVSYPLYRVSSFQRMLTDEFEQYQEEKDRWPAMFRVRHTAMKGGAGSGISAVGEEALRGAELLGVTMKEEVIDYGLAARKAFPSVVRDDEKEKRITLGAVSGLEEHVELLYGCLPKEDSGEKGLLEIMVSDTAMVEQDILLEDEYTFDGLTLSDGTTIRLKVVGIFRPLDESETYWEAVDHDISRNVYTPQSVFERTFLGGDAEKQYTLNGTWSFVWDYETLPVSGVSSLMQTMEELKQSEALQGKISDSGYMEILSEYGSKAKRVEATLFILQVPVLLLLCAFLYMIAGQMLQMEQNEISLLRSRGASKGQTFLLYLMQSVFLGGISLAAGLPLGALFCKLLGSSTAFLEFSVTRSLPIQFTSDVIPYALGAMLLSVIVTTLPVISYSRLSIVHLKQSRSRKHKALWKRVYLDVILLAVSVYGYYSFSRSEDQVAADVLEGNSLDPLLYVSFSLFILGAGLFCARMQPFLLKGIFALLKNKIRPSTYASLLGTMRTAAKQEFIIMFLILTVAIGIADTTIARTIVLNEVNNRKHLMGAELAVKEKWVDNSAAVAMGWAKEVIYMEPDFGRYQVIPGVETATPVISVEGGSVSGKDGIDAAVMGIRAQGFYQVTDMETGLLPFSFAEYLNVLATDPQAVLVSENFMVKQGYRLGDVISYRRPDGMGATGRIAGFFPYWPGYMPETYLSNEDGSVETADQYLIVANYSYLRGEWGVYPYEVWMKTSDGGEGFYQWLEANPEIHLTKLKDIASEESRIIQDTMFQGTNGILSMSFIVILLLCCVGYLIYWIMSIRSRELLFGVLRAMGMKKREITWLLAVEQICSGLYAIVCGGAVGTLSSRMFVPLIQKAYTASGQVLPLRLIVGAGDLIQLFFVIGAMLCICLAVLGWIVSKMNISSALKLGED